VKKTTLQKIMYPIMFIYVGIAFYLANYMFGQIMYQTGTLFSSLAIIFVFLGICMFFYQKLSQKIDDTMKIKTSMENVGIDQIIPSEKYSLESIIAILPTNLRICVVININKMTDRFHYFIKMLACENNADLSLLITGTPNEPNQKYFLEDIYQSANKNKNLQIRANSSCQVDNTIIFNKNNCIIHFTNYIEKNDNIPSMFFVFQSSSTMYNSFKTIFDRLWNENKEIKDITENK